MVQSGNDFILLTFMGCLVSTMHCATCFSCINSFIPTTYGVGTLFPFYSWGKLEAWREYGPT